MTGPDAALAVCRFAHDAAILVLWGAFAFLAWCVPSDLGVAVGCRLEGVRRCAVAVAIGTTFLALPIEIASIGNGWADVIDPATASAVLRETGVGRAWQAQAVLGLLLAATLVVPARRRSVATAVVAGLLVADLTQSGHAAMDAGWLGAAHRTNDGLHVLAAGAWLGALVPLLPILAALGDPTRHRNSAIALRRFSTLGHGVVAVVIVTGALNARLVVGRWPVDVSVPYQAVLWIKIALILAMTVLALANRYGIVPRIAHLPGRAVHCLRIMTIAEIGLGLAALVCVAIFGLLDPR